MVGNDPDRAEPPLVKFPFVEIRVCPMPFPIRMVGSLERWGSFSLTGECISEGIILVLGGFLSKGDSLII